MVVTKGTVETIKEYLANKWFRVGLLAILSGIVLLMPQGIVAKIPKPIGLALALLVFWRAFWIVSEILENGV